MDPPQSDALDRAKVRAAFVASTVMFAGVRGLETARILQHTGLTVEDLVDLDRWISARSVVALWNLLDATFPGQALSLEMARAAPHTLFGPMAYGGQYAATLREALQIFARYRALYSADLEVRLVERGDEAYLQVHHLIDAHDKGYSGELGMAVGLRMIREVMGVEDALARVDFVYPPHGPIVAYTDFFGVEVRFGQPRMAYVFRPGALSLKPKHADRQLFAYIEAHAESLRQQLLDKSTSSELKRIHEAVAHNGARGEYGAQALARQLGMGVRSLQRLLQPYQLTIRELLEQAREAHAVELLADPRLSIEEVAFLLGYSAERAFSRAFKRWTGKTPAKWRRVLRETASHPPAAP